MAKPSHIAYKGFLQVTFNKRVKSSCLYQNKKPATGRNTGNYPEMQGKTGRENRP